jgi:hypothetical protein
VPHPVDKIILDRSRRLARKFVRVRVTASTAETNNARKADNFEKALLKVQKPTSLMTSAAAKHSSVSLR